MTRGCPRPRFPLQKGRLGVSPPAQRRDPQHGWVWSLLLIPHPRAGTAGQRPLVRAGGGGRAQPRGARVGTDTVPVSPCPMSPCPLSPCPVSPGRAPHTGRSGGSSDPPTPAGPPRERLQQRSLDRSAPGAADGPGNSARHRRSPGGPGGGDTGVRGPERCRSAHSPPGAAPRTPNPKPQSRTPKPRGRAREAAEGQDGAGAARAEPGGGRGS